MKHILCRVRQTTENRVLYAEKHSALCVCILAMYLEKFLAFNRCIQRALCSNTIPSIIYVLFIVPAIISNGFTFLIPINYVMPL